MRTFNAPLCQSCTRRIPGAYFEVLAGVAYVAPRTGWLAPGAYHAKCLLRAARACVAETVA